MTKQIHYTGWTRDDEAETDVTIGYTFSPGHPAYTPRGEYAPIDPPEGPEVEIVGAWEKDAVIAKGSEPTITLTAAEEEKARDWIIENHEDEGPPED